MKNEETPSWLLTVIEYRDGLKKIFKIRSKAPQNANEKELSTCVILEWSLSGNMPSKEVMLDINRFQDAISELDTEEGESTLFHVITGAGIREWCFYTKDYHSFINKFNALLETLPKYPVNIEYQENTDWGYWNSILEFAKEEKAFA